MKNDSKKRDASAPKKERGKKRDKKRRDKEDDSEEPEEKIVPLRRSTRKRTKVVRDDVGKFDDAVEDDEPVEGEEEHGSEFLPGLEKESVIEKEDSLEDEKGKSIEEDIKMIEGHKPHREDASKKESAKKEPKMSPEEKLHVKEVKDLIRGKPEQFASTFEESSIYRNPKVETLGGYPRTVFRNWYNFWHEKLYPLSTSSPDASVMSTKYRDHYYNKMFTEYVEPRHRNMFVQLIIDHLPPKYKKVYAQKEIEIIVQDLRTCNSLQKMVKIVEKSPPHARLKSTAKAIEILMLKEKDLDETFLIAWFYAAIKPALSLLNTQILEDLEIEDIKAIQKVCSVSPLHQLKDDESLCYISILNHASLADLDEIYVLFNDRSDIFWQDVLTKTFQVKPTIAKIMIANKEGMLTQDLLQYIRSFAPDEKFIEIVKRFQRMNLDSIKQLQKLYGQKNFNNVFYALDQKQTHNFQVFYSQSQPYLNLSHANQIDQSKTLLKQVPLDKWQSCQSSILNSSSMVLNVTSQNVVKEKIETVRRIEKVKSISAEQIEMLQTYWTDGMDSLKSAAIIQEHQWQKELVQELVSLVIFGNQTNIACTVGTGHGKSVIIALLAEILAMQKCDVVIVCLNEFLANWGERFYRTSNVIAQKVTYLSLNTFLRRQPNTEKIVIYDEIDQMIGNCTFEIQEKGDSVETLYRTQRMGRWGGFIGFSGTISKDIMSQINTEIGKCLILEIPSLKKDNIDNKLVKVVSSIEKDRNQAVIDRILELKNEKNFVVLFQDRNQVQSFTSYKDYAKITAGRTVVVIENYSSNFMMIEKNIRSLVKDSFIVVTTREGGRGVDFKGLSPAHVILAYKPESKSELLQALGRGSRDLMKFAEGTLICEDPITEDPGEYLDLLEVHDSEKAKAFELNSRIASLFHGKTYKKMISYEENLEKLKRGEQPQVGDGHFTMVVFQQVMKKGENLITTEGGDIIYQALRLLDESKQMPIDQYQEWKKS